MFQPVGDRFGVPAADRVRHEFQRRLAIAVDHADDRAARIAVERALDRDILAQHRAELGDEFADAPREHRFGIARGLEERAASLLPQSVEPALDRLILEQDRKSTRLNYSTTCATR